VRQVAIIDIHGNVASFTGAKNISPAGGTIAGAKSTQLVAAVWAERCSKEQIFPRKRI